MKEIEKLFGSVIRRRRKEMKISQEAFADLAGIHRTYISSIELGKVQVSINIAQKLADTLNTPLSIIWGEIEQELRTES
tara:strand:+ start:11666 stop:11902 length:237 start_codon:yes stop_codon:yes gene_type:complete